MKAIVHDRYGDADVLEFRDIERPEPVEGQVLLRVTAASVNPLDWHLMSGQPYLVRLVAGLRAPKRRVRGSDVAGVVEAVGPGVETLAVGDRVFGMASTGSFAEYAVASAGGLLAIPAGLSDAAAASIPVAGVTALQGLRDHGGVQRGRRVLINGAAGGVGTFAVQLAVAMGAEVTAVCSGRNVDMVRRLGASRVVDYQTEDVVDGDRYDVMIDNVGNRSIADCRRLLVDGGTYVMISGPKDNPVLDPFRRMLAIKARFLFDSRRVVSFTAKETSGELANLAAFVDAGQLTPEIDRHYPLSDAAEAIRYIETGHARAKVIIDVAA